VICSIHELNTSSTKPTVTNLSVQRGGFMADLHPCQAHAVFPTHSTSAASAAEARKTGAAGRESYNDWRKFAECDSCPTAADVSCARANNRASAPGVKILSFYGVF
jgi:hypothetical protein